MEESERLVVVSNRLPVTVAASGDGWQVKRSAGGLATAMNLILRGTNGIWIGWPGDSSGIGDPKREALLRRIEQRDRYIAVELPSDIAKAYYEGFANQTLWPLFHYFPSQLVFDPAGWDAYMEANRRFRDAVVEHYLPGDLLWVHDYHLIVLPQLLREALPEARIGFFLHTPFPSTEVFRIIPRREELLQGLFGADLLAFHTHSHLQHFRSSLLRILGIESRIGQVDVGGRTVRFEALPIGIAPEEFTGLLNNPETIAYLEELRQRFRGRRILLAVDRLDYTKGIPQRLRAYRRLLDGAPELHREVVLIQVAVPSREHIFSYEALRREVNELVGEINGRFGTPDWTPVVYIRRAIARPQLVALYAASDVGWITPLRDGMNLVAKEYVACKRAGEGVLVLSEFAGAAEEMGEALLVNPFDEERTAAVLARALSLSPEERRERMTALHKRVLRNNVFAWSDRFLADLRAAAASRAAGPAERPVPLDVPAIVQAYSAASARILFIDYDGTLVPFARRPQHAIPPPELTALLERLAADPANAVMLISGRRREDLDRWFGPIANLWLAAEHGAVMRPAGSQTWEALRQADPEWKPRVQPILEHFVSRTPGSLIEEKEYSLVWHYRMAHPEFGEWLANELVAMLEGRLAETELRAIRGRKTVEVKPGWANKGEVVEKVLAAKPGADFRFAVGDDRTDEDTFARLDPEAWTVHVGGGSTRARFSLPDSANVRRLLDRFANAGRFVSGGVSH